MLSRFLNVALASVFSSNESKWCGQSATSRAAHAQMCPERLNKKEPVPGGWSFSDLTARGDPLALKSVRPAAVAVWVTGYMCPPAEPGAYLNSCLSQWMPLVGAQQEVWPHLLLCLWFRRLFLKENKRVGRLTFPRTTCASVLRNSPDKGLQKTKLLCTLPCVYKKGGKGFLCCEISTPVGILMFSLRLKNCSVFGFSCVDYR